MTKTLTTLEEQVLQAIAGLLIDSSPDYSCTDTFIAWRGRRLFGTEWVGQRNGTSYPKINAALGRLARKNLVYRVARENRRWGEWYLTTEGRSLLGFPPAAA